jgi:hypothetical protein
MTTLDDARAIYCFGFIHVSLALSQTGKSDRNGIPDFSYGPRASKAADILTKNIERIAGFLLFGLGCPSRARARMEIIRRMLSQARGRHTCGKRMRLTLCA